MTPRLFLALLKETAVQWTRHKAQRLGAALAYYTIFALAPLLIIFITIVGIVYGQETAQAELFDQLQALVGPDSANFIQTLVVSARRSNSDIIATLIGVGTLMFGAVGMFAQLQDALNTIWDVNPDAGHGVKRMVRDRAVALAMVLCVGFLLLLMLFTSTAIVTLGHYFSALLPVPATALELVNLALSFAMATLLFALLFKFLPDARIDWSDVWHGALVTSLLFTLGKFLIAWYLGTSSVSSVYGTAGSLAALLVWIYYSAQIILFGAEFTHVYARRARKFVERAKPGEISDKFAS